MSQRQVDEREGVHRSPSDNGSKDPLLLAGSADDDQAEEGTLTCDDQESDDDYTWGENVEIWKQRRLTDLFMQSACTNKLSAKAVNRTVNIDKRKRHSAERTTAFDENCFTDVNNLKILKELEANVLPKSKRPKNLTNEGINNSEKNECQVQTFQNDSNPNFEDEYDKILKKVNDFTTKRKSVSNPNVTKGRTHVTTTPCKKDVEIQNQTKSDKDLSDYIFQEYQTDRLPDDAHSVWTQARTASVDAMKNKKLGRFYKKAIKKNIIDDWALGLEKAPSYALARPLSDKIAEIRRKMGMEIMQVTADHLTYLGEKQSRVAAGNLSTVKNMTEIALRKANQGENAEETYNKSVVAIENLVAREEAKEEKLMEEKSKQIGKNKLTTNEMVDPASTIQKRQMEAQRSGFHFNDNRGRGPYPGRRPGRRGRGRRPGGRPY